MSQLGLDRYRAGARYRIINTIGHSSTDTDTWLYKFFVLKMRFCVGYRCVQVIYVCGVYARKYSIGLKLQVCIATVLTVETGKRTTGLLYRHRYSNKYRLIPIPTYTGKYWPIPDTRYWYRSNPSRSIIVTSTCRPQLVRTC